MAGVLRGVEGGKGMGRWDPDGKKSKKRALFWTSGAVRAALLFRETPETS